MHGNRIKLRQQLEKEKLENERKREEGELMMRREAIVTQSSSTMEVPQRHQLPQISVEVPQNVLEVRSKLQNPTSFHIASVRKNQLHQFLSTQGTSMGSQSAPPPGTNQIFGGNSSGGGNNGSQHIGGGISSFSVQKDPLLSSGFTHSPRHQQSIPSVMSNTGRGGDVFSYPPITIKSESPTMMITDQSQESENDQALLNDLIGLEDKYGDTLGQIPYFEPSNLMLPQTLPVATNLLDVFGVTSGNTQQMFLPQMSASCPPEMKEEKMNTFGMNPTQSIDLKVFQKDRQKKNNHNMIERRRRFNINDRIKELGMLLPSTESEARQNKGTILKASVEYIHKLQRDVQRLKLQESTHKQLEHTNRQMRLRIQELEMTARAHGIPTPSLTPETKELAEAAEKVLGTTPRSRSPSSTNATPLSPNLFCGDQLSDVIRASPGIDLSKLNIKTEPDMLDPMTPSPVPVTSPDMLMEDFTQPFLPSSTTVMSTTSMGGDIFSTPDYLTSSSISSANATIFGES